MLQTPILPVVGSKKSCSKTKSGSAEPLLFVYFLDPADDLSRQDHGQEGPGDALHGDVAEGQHQHCQVADEVDALDGPAGDVVQTHGQGVVTRRGAARPDADTGADADEEGSRDGGDEGIAGDLRPQGRELLQKCVGGGIGSDGQGRIGNKGFSKGFPAQGVTYGVEHQGGHGGGEGKPLFQQQGQAQDAALGDVGNGVNVVNADGLNDGTDKDNETVGGS